MSDREVPKPGSTFGVLDVETSPDPEATLLLGGRAAAKQPAGVHAVTAAAMLSATEMPDGSWTAFALASRGGGPAKEIEVLREVDGFLSGLQRADGRLVTYNGVRHDLGLLRRRMARHWMFDCRGIACAAGMRHDDLFHRITRGWRDDRPSLRAACAGLGISADPDLPPACDMPRQLRKCETDVVATFLLLLYELAIERGDVGVLANGWTALANHLDRPSLNAAHLRQFGRHRCLAAMREAGLAPTVGSSPR